MWCKVKGFFTLVVGTAVAISVFLGTGVHWDRKEGREQRNHGLWCQPGFHSDASLSQMCSVCVLVTFLSLELSAAPDQQTQEEQLTQHSFFRVLRP